MGISNIWVFAQTTDGAASSATLELLTKASSLGGSVTAFVAGTAGDGAAAFADHGAAKIYETGDLAGALPGAAVSAAMKSVIDGGDSPDLVMFPQNYEGRDVMSRLSVKLDRTVLTNSTDVAVDGDSVSVVTPIFGGAKLVTSTFTGEAPYLAAFRPKSFEPAGGAGGAGEVVAAPVPDLGATGGASVTAVHVEETSGPKLDEAAVVVFVRPLFVSWRECKKSGQTWISPAMRILPRYLSSGWACVTMPELLPRCFKRWPTSASIFI